MKTWNSVVFVKTKSSWSDPSKFAGMQGVQSLWSTSGPWDWAIELDQTHSSPEETEVFVKNLRKSEWVADTNTCWWKKEKESRV